MSCGENKTPNQTLTAVPEHSVSGNSCAETIAINPDLQISIRTVTSLIASILDTMHTE